MMERDEEGKRAGFTDKVTLAFFVLVVVAFAALVAAGWQIETARNQSSRNHTLVVNLDTAQTNLASALARLDAATVKIGALQKAETEGCMNYETLRKASNKFNGTIHRLIDAGNKTRLARVATGHDQTLKADIAGIKLDNELLSETRPVTASCAQKQN